MAAIKLKLDPTQVSEEVLQALLDEGIIQPGQLEDAYMQTGEMRDELWAEVEHLDGALLSMTEACEKYEEINFPSLKRWIEQGFIRTLGDRPPRGRGHKWLLNEADVAYAALMLRKRGKWQGKRLFTPETLPPYLVPA